jgi:hypothetical protein
MNARRKSALSPYFPIKIEACSGTNSQVRRLGKLLE